MKKYSSNRAQKGKTAYRTPSRLKIVRPVVVKSNKKIKNNYPRPNTYKLKAKT